MNLFNKRLLESKLKNYHLPEDFSRETSTKTISDIQHFLQTEADRTGEKEIQGLFLQRVFETILGFPSQLAGLKEFNLKVEPKTETDTSRPDGSLGFFSTFEKTLAVIELKDASTSLDRKQYGRALQMTPVEQGFSYSPRYSGCRWVIVSNFREIRLYSVDKGINYYEKFDFENLDNEDDLKKFHFLLSKQNLISKGADSATEELLKEAYVIEEKITNDFYENYKNIRYLLFQHLIENNENFEKEILLEKTQKILDRVLFVCFCEDLELLPVNLLRRILRNAEESFDSSDRKVWRETKNLFRSIDRGNYDQNINQYNGGLFAEDLILDKLVLKDTIIKELIKISDYDFSSELNVNILGHVFEQSISDLEEIKADIAKEVPERQLGRRRSEGIYYTPEHITNYVVTETLSRWLNGKRQELGFGNLPELTEKEIKAIKVTRKSKLIASAKIKKHLEFWESYKKVVENIKVIDPACGSGAFLNQVFDYLYQEGQSINKSISEFKVGQTQIFDLDKHILTNNIFGVDLNEESAEITKLSLWLKTARKDKPLTTLDQNILVGNSLINDTNIVGNKAFSWDRKFEDIFKQGGFDIIIGNPPYDVLSEKETGLKNIPQMITFFKSDEVLSKSMRGKNNLYKLFIAKALSLLKKDGYFSYIVPMALLGDDQARPVRKLLLDTSIQGIECFPQKDDPKKRVFEDAKLSTSIFVTKNSISNTSFFVRTHPGKWIETDLDEALEINKEEIIKFDKENLTIPNCNKKDWVIIKKILGRKYFRPLGNYVKQYQGEINETTQGEEGVISKNNSFPPILRGSNITMFAVREASQGENLYLQDTRYLKGKKKDSKALHHLLERVGFQRSSPQNNFRRIIAAPIKKNFYCFDTVSYVTEKSSKINLEALIGLLNSNLYDWFFRCFSTNSKVNEYQLNMLPFFEVTPLVSQKFLDLVNEKRYPELINQFDSYVSENQKVPSVVLDLVKHLVREIIEKEEKRILKSRKERALLGQEGSILMKYLNTLIYKSFGLTDDDIDYIETRLTRML